MSDLWPTNDPNEYCQDPVKIVLEEEDSITCKRFGSIDKMLDVYRRKYGDHFSAEELKWIRHAKQIEARRKGLDLPSSCINPNWDTW